MTPKTPLKRDPGGKCQTLRGPVTAADVRGWSSLPNNRKACSKLLQVLCLPSLGQQFRGAGPVPLAPAHRRGPARPPGSHPAGFLSLALETRPQGVMRLSALLMVTWLVNDRPQCKLTSSRGPGASAAHHAPRPTVSREGREGPCCSGSVGSRADTHPEHQRPRSARLIKQAFSTAALGTRRLGDLAVWGCPPH